VAGIAVSIGARIAAAAMPAEVLVSSTVKDLVAGSGLAFEISNQTATPSGVIRERWPSRVHCALGSLALLAFVLDVSGLDY
jgi:class 3 adenylate cyclase